MSHSPTRLASTSTTEPLPRRFHWLVRTLLAMVAMILMLVPLLATALVLQAVVPHPTTDAELLLGHLPSLTVPLGLLALLWVLMRFVDRRPLREAGLFVDRRTLPTFLLGFVLLLVVQVGATALTHTMGFAGPVGPVEDDMVYYILGLLARTLIHAALCEEILFRGYLTQTLPQRSPWVVAGISAVAFGAMHMLSQGQDGLERVTYAIGPTGWAFLAAALVVVFRNVAPAVGVHFGAYVASDISAVLGHGEGPAAWVATGVLAAVVGAAILFWHGRRVPEMPSPLFAKA